MDGKRFDDLMREMEGGASRRRILGILAGSLAAAVGVRGAGAAKAAKVDVCHLTGNGSYVLISVSENAIPAHAAHGDVIAPDFANDAANCGGCGIVCDDGDPCTVDACVEGQCAATAVDCSALSDQCNAGVCDAISGGCIASPINEGLACTTVSGITGVCQAGGCAEPFCPAGSVYLSPCGVSGSSCFCELTTEGGVACVDLDVFVGCGVDVCDSTDDCPAGSVCNTQGCGGVGHCHSLCNTFV